MTAPNFGELLERSGFKFRALRSSMTHALTYSNKTHDQHGRPMFQHHEYCIGTRFGLVSVQAYRQGRFVFADPLPGEFIGKRSFVTGPGWRIYFSAVIAGVLVSSKEVLISGPVLRDAQVAAFAMKFAARAVELVMERKPAGAPR